MPSDTVEYDNRMSISEIPRLRPAKPLRLFEAVCEQVRSQIASGELKPGDKLPAERELAAQFGISRPAVREALRSLEFAGLIKLQKGVKGGSFVLGTEMGLVNSFQVMFSINRLSLEELTEIRIEVQDIVIRLAVQNRTDEDIAALTEDVRQTKQALSQSAFVSKPSITQNFYTLLAEATRNRVLVVLVKALSEMLYQSIVRLNPPLNFDLVEVRTRLIDALKTRDEAQARAIMREYLEFLHHYIVSRHAEIALSSGN